MVGYITASLKNVKETRVGDTVTNAEHPCAEPLPGYRKVNPMVYCGMYRQTGPSTRTYETRWRSCSSTTLLFSLNRRRR